MRPGGRRKGPCIARRSVTATSTHPPRCRHTSPQLKAAAWAGRATAVIRGQSRVNKALQLASVPHAPSGPGPHHPVLCHISRAALSGTGKAQCQIFWYLNLAALHYPVRAGPQYLSPGHIIWPRATSPGHGPGAGSIIWSDLNPWSYSPGRIIRSRATFNRPHIRHRAPLAGLATHYLVPCNIIWTVAAGSQRTRGIWQWPRHRPRRGHLLTPNRDDAF